MKYCSKTFYEAHQPNEIPFADYVDTVTEQGLNFPVNSSKGCANVVTGADYVRTTTVKNCGVPVSITGGRKPVMCTLYR